MSWVARKLGCGTRSHCRSTSLAFNRIEDDLHNIFPALAEINEARGARLYWEIPSEARSFGRCDVEIQSREIEPRLEVRGDIARADNRGQTTVSPNSILETWFVPDFPRKYSISKTTGANCRLTGVG